MVTLRQRHHVEADNYGQNYSKFDIKLLMDARSISRSQWSITVFLGNMVFDLDIVKGTLDCMRLL